MLELFDILFLLFVLFLLFNLIISCDLASRGVGFPNI